MDRIFMSHIALLSVLAVSSTQMLGEFGYPCHPKWHVSLQQHYRNTGFDTRPGDTPMCDNHLKKGWYTFVDARGAPNEMATRCPGSNTCGTATPIWMNGSHPQVKDGIVVRALCGQVSDNTTSQACCDFKDDLFVKNCSGFYVYYLSPTSSCPVSYCAGTARRCPVGKWSNTSLEPCRDLAPVLTVPPVIKGPNVRANQTFDYQCQILFAPNDPDQAFQVVWTFNNRSDPSIRPDILIGSQKVATLRGDTLKSHIDSEVGCQVSTYYIPEQNKNIYTSETSYFGVQLVNLTGPHLRGNKSFDFECDVTTSAQDPNQNIEVVWTFDGKQETGVHPQVITGGQHKATLDGSAIQGHLNSHVGCQARLVYEGYSMKSEFRKSNTYFAGIQVSPGRLEINVSEGEKALTVTSTIPVVCDQARDCCVTYKAVVDKHSVVTLKDSCNFSLCLEDWISDHKNASFTIAVVPARNAISSGTREAVLSFENISVSGTGHYLDIFKAYRPDPVQIVVRLEAGFTCSITGDPHFQGFDFKRVYNLYQTGDYTVYAVKDREFLVQIRAWPCWAVACICGVVVRESNDVIKVAGCEKPGHLVSATVDVPHNLSAGTAIRRSSNGRHVGILLSSGSAIKLDIHSRYMDLYIQTPAYDRNKASGICGTNDGRPDNDFTHPDGTVTPACEGPGRCAPVPFMESWRVTGPASMFVTSPTPASGESSQHYCSCPARSQLSLSCSPRQHIQDSNLSCKNCKDITRYLQPSPWGQPGHVETAYTHRHVTPVDPNKQWPNDQGVTESQAKDMCSRAIKKSQLYDHCKDVESMLDSAMDECLGDVLDGGTNDTLPAVTSSFTSKCQMSAASEDKNYQHRPDGGVSLQQQFSDNICPGECSDHGRCAHNGTCLCQDGWQGDTCQIEAGKGPQIAWSSGSPWCDVNQMSCQHLQFDKSNVDIHDKLKCRIQRMNKRGDKAGQPLIIDADGVSSTRVVCSLPKTNLSSDNYTISVTSDGALYGNELPVHTFDALCLNCSHAGCHVKNTGCHISNMCYRDGATNRHNGQLVCDTTRNLTDWSPASESIRTLSRSATAVPSGTTPAPMPDNTDPRKANNQMDYDSKTSSSDSGSHLSTVAAQARTSDQATDASVPVQATWTSIPLSFAHSISQYPSTVPTDSSAQRAARSVGPAVRITGSPITDRSIGSPTTVMSMGPTPPGRAVGLISATRSSDVTTRDRYVGPATPAHNIYKTTNKSASTQPTPTGGVSDTTTSRLSNHTKPAQASGQTTPAQASGQTTPAQASGQTTTAQASGQTTPAQASGQTTPAQASGQTTPAQASGQTTTAQASGQTTTAQASGQTTPAQASGQTTPAQASGQTTPAQASGQTRLSGQATPTTDSGSTTSVSSQTAPTTASNGTTASGVAAESTSISSQRILHVLEHFIEQMKSLMDRLRKP